MISTPSDIEKINLEAHVELCSERYKSLDEKMDQVHNRMSILEQHVIAIKDGINSKTTGINKQLLAIATTIIAALLTANVTLIINLIDK